MKNSVLKDKSKKELLILLQSYQEAIDTNIISSITDLKGNIVHVNEKFCEVSKYPKEELIGQNHSIINSGYHPKAFFKDMWKTIGTGNVWKGDVRNRAKDGSIYWVETVILPVKDDNNKIQQYLSLRTLITKRKKLEFEKEQYITSLKELIFMTSHNIRRPVSSCLGLMQVVDDTPLSQDDLQTMIEHFKISANELEGFTQDLTTYLDKLEKKYNNKTKGKTL